MCVVSSVICVVSNFDKFNNSNFDRLKSLGRDDCLRVACLWYSRFVNRRILVNRRLRCLQCAKAVNVTCLFVAASSVKLKPLVQIGYFLIFFNSSLAELLLFFKSLTV